MPAPLINGLAVVWADIQVSFLGTPLTGVTAINYTEKQEKTNNYGIGNKPVSRGYGRKTYEGSITMLAEEWKNILAASPGGSLNNLPFFDLTFTFLNIAGPYMNVTLKAVDFMESNFDAKEGDTMIPITMPFIYADQNVVVI
jgi:hypothetical protein